MLRWKDHRDRVQEKSIRLLFWDLQVLHRQANSKALKNWESMRGPKTLELET